MDVFFCCDVFPDTPNEQLSNVKPDSETEPDVEMPSRDGCGPVEQSIHFDNEKRKEEKEKKK